MTTFNVRCAASGDDGWWQTAQEYISLNGANVRMGHDSTFHFTHAFMRFPSVTIPQGAHIDSAHVTFKADGDRTGTCHLIIYAEAHDNATAPTTYSAADAKNVTAAHVHWDPAAWTNTTLYDTDDISAIIQEIVDRPGWGSGSAILILIKDDTSDNDVFRYAISYDTDPATAPQLDITYSFAPIVAVPGEATTSGSAFMGVRILGEPGDSESSGSASVMIQNHGSAAISLPLLTSDGELAVRSGSLSQDLPLITVSAGGTTGSTGSAAITLPVLSLESDGMVGDIGSSEITLPALSVSGSGYENIVWAFDLTLPSLRLHSHGSQAETDYLVILMNMKNLAVGEYDWSGFNSFAYFNGEYIGAKSTGIHVLEGDANDGLAIDSIISLGQIPIGNNKPRDVYVLGRASGLMELVVVSDEETEKELTVPYLFETLYEARAKIPRGIDPVYVSFTLKNKNGSNFDIDEIQVYGEGQARKKK